MKLAEALSLRADLQKRLAQLKGRMKESAKVQEGDTPPEDIAVLEKEFDALLAQLEKLIYRINVTNLATVDDEGTTLTALIARRDVLTLRVSSMREVLDFVSEPDNRYGRNEIKTVRLIDVAEARRKLDERSCSLRELDMKIQSINWTVDLKE